MDFTEIRTSEELRIHLNAPYVNTIRNNIYHYTSLRSLYEIFKNKSIRFSKLAVMNDVIEMNFAENCSDYFFCLSKEPCGVECFGMWSMYGKLAEFCKEKAPEKIGVKIQFSKEIIDNLRNENVLAFHSVAYLNKENGQCFLGSQKNNNHIPIEQDVLAGYIKDGCWKYENEYRLRKTAESRETKIGVPISDTLLKDLIVYPSPVSTVEECEKRFRKLEKEYGRVSVFPNFQKNSYEGTFSVHPK